MSNHRSAIPTVLLVDYDPRSITRLTDLLGSAGWQTVVARDGLEAIELFVRTQPDLALIQDLLPKKHGFEVCREIKSCKQGKHRPVVILSNARHRALVSTGCDAYLGKPYKEMDLLETVRQLLLARRN